MVSDIKIFEGRSALVTGGTRGIGFAMAELLLESGAKVLVTGSQAEGKGPQGSEFFQADFSQEKQVMQLVNFIEENHSVDLLINNAAGYRPSTFDTADADQARRVHEISYITPFRLVHACLPYMKKNNFGRILNIGTLWTAMVCRDRSA